MSGGTVAGGGGSAAGVDPAGVDPAGVDPAGVDLLAGDAAALIAVAVGAVRRLAAQPLSAAVGDDALTDSVAALQRLATMVEADKLRRIAELNARAAHRGRARSTANLLTQQCRLSPGEALHATRLAEDLTELPATAARLADATIGLAHAREASRSLRQLRTAVADGALPADALDTGAARIDGHTASLADPNGTPSGPPDGPPVSVTGLRRDLAALTTTSDSLAARERLALANRRLAIGPADGPDDGMLRIDGLLDPLTGTKLLTALGPLTRRSGPEDTRTQPQRTCDALAALCDASGPDRNRDDARLTPARPCVLLLTTPDALAGTPHATPSTLDGYGPISSATAQQLTCDADVTIVTHDRNNRVLDVGRTRRYPTPRQRRAVTARDQHCIGCTAPTLRCQIHHIRPWHHGGHTDLDNLVLLCQACHTNRPPLRLDHHQSRRRPSHRRTPTTQTNGAM